VITNSNLQGSGKKTEHVPLAPPNLPKGFEPPEWAKKRGQAVRVLWNGDYYVGRVNGYDPRSRRTHVVYGNTSEWLWAVSNHVQPYEGKINPVLESMQLPPLELPPFNLKEYNLEEDFFVKKLEKPVEKGQPPLKRRKERRKVSKSISGNLQCQYSKGQMIEWRDHEGLWHKGEVFKICADGRIKIRLFANGKKFKAELSELKAYNPDVSDQRESYEVARKLKTSTSRTNRKVTIPEVETSETKAVNGKTLKAEKPKKKARGTIELPAIRTPTKPSTLRENVENKEHTLNRGEAKMAAEFEYGEYKEKLEKDGKTYLKYIEDKNGKEYWFCPQTGKSAWELPTGLPEWKEYKSDDGTSYYWNRITKVSTWDRPPEMEEKLPDKGESDTTVELEKTLSTLSSKGKQVGLGLFGVDSPNSTPEPQTSSNESTGLSKEKIVVVSKPNKSENSGLGKGKARLQDFALRLMENDLKKNWNMDFEILARQYITTYKVSASIISKLRKLYPSVRNRIIEKRAKDKNAKLLPVSFDVKYLTGSDFHIKLSQLEMLLKRLQGTEAQSRKGVQIMCEPKVKRCLGEMLDFRNHGEVISETCVQNTYRCIGMFMTKASKSEFSEFFDEFFCPKLMNGLSSYFTQDVQEQALAVLIGLIGASKSYQHFFINRNMLHNLTYAIEHYEFAGLIKQSMQAITLLLRIEVPECPGFTIKLTRHVPPKPCPVDSLFKLISRMLTRSSEDILLNSCISLKLLVQHQRPLAVGRITRREALAKAVQEDSLVVNLLKLLENPKPRIRRAACQTICSIVYPEEEYPTSDKVEKILSNPLMSSRSSFFWLKKALQGSMRGDPEKDADLRLRGALATSSLFNNSDAFHALFCELVNVIEPSLTILNHVGPWLLPQLKKAASTVDLSDHKINVKLSTIGEKLRCPSNASALQVVEMWETRFRIQNARKFELLISVFIRSKILHLLSGLTILEHSKTKGPQIRVFAQQALWCICTFAVDKQKELMKILQLPSLSNGLAATWDDNKYRVAPYPYPQNMLVLVVGDGDLSFSRALCRLHRGSTPKIVATCWETSLELLERYPKAPSTIAEIVHRGGRCLFGVDAVNLKESLKQALTTYPQGDYTRISKSDILGALKFDIVVFNFPHALAENKNPDANGHLVEEFLRNCREILSVDGEVHITFHIDVFRTNNTDKDQYITWQIDQRAKRAGFVHIKKFPLNRSKFPGYAIKNVEGNPFNIKKGDVHVFRTK